MSDSWTIPTQEEAEEYSAAYLAAEEAYYEEMYKQQEECFDENGDPLKDFLGNPWSEET